jgi:HK97 gp10 family phage protein
MSTQQQLIGGGRELDQLLQTLPAKIHKNILRAALRAGAAVVREEARNQVPVASGALRRSIRITTRAKRGETYASVKAGGPIAYYAHMVEFGTRPHRIEAPANSALNVEGSARREVDHPGSRARPFMRPAADAAFTPAIQAVQAKLRERLTERGLNVPAPLPADPEQ